MNTLYQEEQAGVEDREFSLRKVKEILNADSDVIVNLCKKSSVVPKKNSAGKTYFTKSDVGMLKRVQELYSKSQDVKNAVALLPSQDEKSLELAQKAVDNIEKLNTQLAEFEEKLSQKIAAVLDDKLDGMDEVVVELIRAKTENETLRFQINELNKEVFNLKNSLAMYKSVGLNFYIKKSADRSGF